MNRNYVLLFASVVTLLSSCTCTPTKDIKFDAQADPKANFSGYKSYTWLGSAAIIHDTFGQWEPPDFDADTEIKYLIDRELHKRGMSENSTDPDLMVVFAAGFNMDTLKLKVDPDTKKNILTNVPRGGLIIALVDAESGFATWVGVATANIQKQPDTKTAKARLDYAVTQLFEKMPK